MLSDDSFLRNIPVCIPKKPRLRLEGIGFAIDSADLAYQAMREAAKSVACPEDASATAATQINKLRIFSAAWSLIDNLHFLRKLASDTGPAAPAMNTFKMRTHECTTLRNRLHHIHSNLDNLSKSQDASALFGSLSFAWINPEDIAPGTTKLLGYDVIALHSGRPQSLNMHLATGAAASQQIEYPCGWFQLTAFGITTDLSMHYLSMVELAHAFEQEIAPKYREIIRSELEALGHDAEAALRDVGHDLSFRARLSTNNEPQ